MLLINKVTELWIDDYFTVTVSLSYNLSAVTTHMFLKRSQGGEILVFSYVAPVLYSLWHLHACIFKWWSENQEPHSHISKRGSPLFRSFGVRKGRHALGKVCAQVGHVLYICRRGSMCCTRTQNVPWVERDAAKQIKAGWIFISAANVFVYSKMKNGSPTLLMKRILHPWSTKK
jgi:hypothetical protein